VSVTVSMVNSTMSVPCAYRLYLPEVWARDHKRRGLAGVPREVTFATKWEIALAEVDRLLDDDLPRAPVVADAG
jgi:SRSO17 transposase